jgi:ATPase subunit of ABC transporter with duplicated ATPase domains
LNDATVGTPDGLPLFRTGQKWIERGDRVVLLGRNGAGKTQMVRALVRAIAEGDELIRVTPTLVLGHSDQGLGQLGAKATPFDLVTAFKTGDGPARSLLAEAGIRTDMQTKPLAPLSGGQKARLAMLILRLSKPNFYLLDEPTNHLDIEGQEALEAELLTRGATCLLVSHDRSFVRNVGNRFWLIDKKKLVEVADPEAFFAGELGAG